MAEKIDSKVGYLLMGLGVGSLIGILLAPKSGEETREYLSQSVNKGSEYAHKKVRDLRAARKWSRRRKNRLRSAKSSGRSGQRDLSI
jgi:gas vesicle protein